MSQAAKLISIFFIFFALFPLLITGASAEEFELDVTSQNRSVYPNQTGSYSIDIKNEYNTSKDFKIITFSMFPSWFSQSDYTFKLNPQEIKQAEVRFKPPEGTIGGNYTVYVYVSPSSEPKDVFKKKELDFKVLRKEKVILSYFRGFDFSYQDKKVRLKTGIVNLGGVNTTEYSLRLSNSKDTKERSLPSIYPGYQEIISSNLSFKGLLEGKKLVKAELISPGGIVVDKKLEKINVPPIENVKTVESSQMSFIWTEFNIKLKNKGNVGLRDVTYSKEFRKFISALIFTEKDPEVRNEEGKSVYTWTIDEIEPGETVTINLKINYWIIYFIIGFSVLIALFAHRVLTSGGIEKFATRSGRYHKIHLHVVNNTGSLIKKVKIKDKVPEIADLVGEYDTKKPDSVKETDEGTFLTWKVDSMSEGEEIVIDYKIKSLVEVKGKISLPSASFEYVKGSKEKSKISNNVKVDFKS